MRRLVVIFLAAALMVVLVAAPATAVVDEIVGAWCSGKSLQPPGIDGSKRESNAARPLVASKVVSIHFEEVPHLHVDLDRGPEPHVELPGPHATFDFTRPNVKIQPAFFIVNVAERENPEDPLPPPFYIDGFELKSAFPAFQNCPNLLS